MAVKKPGGTKKYFTVAEANAALPLVRAILRDITELARDLRERHDRLSRVKVPAQGKVGEAHQEELQQVQADFDRDQQRMEEYEKELRVLGIELKDYHSGLIDFPCLMNNHEAYLCWKLGEPEVAYWHELDSGFAGRQKLPDTTSRTSKPETTSTASDA